MSDEELLDAITRVRSHNNVNWIEVLRIALKADPKGTRAVVSKILMNDLEISRLTRALANEDRQNSNLPR